MSEYRLSTTRPPSKIWIYSQEEIDRAGWMPHHVSAKPLHYPGPNPEYIKFDPFGVPEDPEPWKHYFEPGGGAPLGEGIKPGFVEIFTNGKGKVTNEEVRAEEQYAAKAIGEKVNIDDNSARSSYNTKLGTDHELYRGPVTLQEAAATLSPELSAKLIRDMPKTTKFTGGEVGFYLFMVQKRDKSILIGYDDFGNPQYAPVGNELVEAVCVALMGPHCYKRTLFYPAKYPAGTAKVFKAGRDVAFLWEAVPDALALFAYNPAHAIAKCQTRQANEGRPITMPGGKSNLLPMSMR